MVAYFHAKLLPLCSKIFTSLTDLSVTAVPALDPRTLLASFPLSKLCHIAVYTRTTLNVKHGA